MIDTMFKKRRNGWALAKKQFKDRLMINKGLRYGWKADIYMALLCFVAGVACVGEEDCI